MDNKKWRMAFGAVGCAVALHCSDRSGPTSGSAGGFGASAVSTAGGAVGGTSSTGETTTSGPLEVPVGPASTLSLPEPSAGGAGGAAGAAGAAGAPGGQDTSPPSLSGEPWLSGIWDDNLNFDWFTRLQLESAPGQLTFEPGDYEAANQRYSLPAKPREALDVALVLDTTGSMGDELGYLQENVARIWEALQTQHPEVAQRWALVVYRDEGDNYVTESFDFTTNQQTYLEHLRDQKAEGGGDRPEASDEALAAMNQLAWSPGSQSAREAFWVTDAPHHDDRAERVTGALLDAQASDIRVHAIASDNVDEFTARTLRTAAQITGGHYLFLFGISTEASALLDTVPPCFYTTPLSKAMLRVLEGELAGEHLTPDPASLVGSYGEPAGGQCDSGLGPSFAY